MENILEFIKDIILPVIAIVVSIVAICQSSKANTKSDEATNTANNISTGQIELNISMLIKETENRVMDLAISMSKYFKNDLSDSEKKELEFLQNAYNQAVESNLNAYEEACAKYLDSKTDKERFKRMYSVPVRRLLENKDLEKYFPAHNSSYKCILKVHKEWFDLEK